MAKKYANIVHDNGEWQIQKPNSKGIPEVKEQVPDVVPMGELESIRVFQGLIKEETNARRASLSMLAHIWNFGNSAEFKKMLQKHVGKGDKKTGALSPALKDDFRTAEDLYFKQWLDEEHPEHKDYLQRLPIANEKGQELPETERHSYFVTRTRAAPSYSNAKNLFLNYVAFVGHEPFTMSDDGAELVGIEPPEVMRERVASAKKDVAPPDRSWEKRMQDLIAELINPENPEKPLQLDGSKLAGLVQDVKILQGELQRRLKHHEKMVADLQAQGKSVPAAAGSMIDKAQQSAKIDGKPLPQVQEEKAQGVKA